MKERRADVKAMIMDLDGTIVDSTEAYDIAADVAFASIGKRGRPNSSIEIPRRLELNLPLDDLIGEADQQAFLDTYLKTYYDVTCFKTEPLIEIPTLVGLAERMKLALMTMRRVPKEAIIREMKAFGLLEYFELIMTAHETPYVKPSPEPIRRCAARLGVRAGECVIVGDSVVDVRGGKNAEAWTVGVLTGIFTKAELEAEKPDFILENVNALQSILR